MQNHLAELIRDARKREGLERKHLALLLGTSRSRIDRMESGTLTLSAQDLLALTQIFGSRFELGTEDLMGEVISTLAARIRSFLGTTQFRPEEFVLRDWMQRTLHRLDHTHVAAAS